MNTPTLAPMARVTLIFRTAAPRSPMAQVALRSAVAQLASVGQREVHIVTPTAQADRLTLELPVERALSLLTLYAAADPGFDRLGLIDLVLAEGSGFQAYYFASGAAREHNRDTLRAIGARALAAVGQDAALSRSDVDLIVDQGLTEEIEEVASTVFDSAELRSALVLVAMRLLGDTLLSVDLSTTPVLGDDLPPLAPAISASELAGLLRDSGISAEHAQLSRLAEAINSAIIFQLNIPRPHIDRQRMVGVRVKLASYFSLEELYNLCFDLGVDYEDLPGGTKSGKARELVAFCERHQRIEPLLARSRELRPHVLW